MTHFHRFGTILIRTGRQIRPAEQLTGVVILNEVKELEPNESHRNSAAVAPGLFLGGQFFRRRGGQRKIENRRRRSLGAYARSGGEHGDVGFALFVAWECRSSSRCPSPSRRPSLLEPG